MAIEKKTVKKTVKKTAAAKPAAPKTTAKKVPVKKSPAKTVVTSKKPSVPQERFYAMVSEAAYFAAQNDGNKKGSVEYWIEAEAAVRAKFDVA